MRHEPMLQQNPRMSMQLKNLGRLDTAARESIAIHAKAHRFAQL
jgi:deoxyribodipyrimidine photolyase-related protein